LTNITGFLSEYNLEIFDSISLSMKSIITNKVMENRNSVFKSRIAHQQI